MRSNYDRKDARACYPLAPPFCAAAQKSIAQAVLKRPPSLIILYLMEHGLWESQIRLGCRANCAAVQHLKYTHIPRGTKMRSVGKWHHLPTEYMERAFLGFHNVRCSPGTPKKKTLFQGPCSSQSSDGTVSVCSL
ncbi:MULTISPECIES: hypothetical protein [Maribacter]|uniref:Uncharacterized protein n=1 Tax=Maribacter flavus TaxID=1658664 RepID=A0ABU7ILB9_9FLAO|nr:MULTISPECIES: hypothetical protein [Maribacter]MDC6406338.1 hypothetical protein [Maribacter sp. PR66]MEE1973458.1 hypothetical protein [Maribacter flavus]